MTIGILCEGENTDALMIERILRQTFPQAEFIIRGRSKNVIFALGDLELKKLFDDGADRAIIVWDLLPVGTQMAISSQPADEIRPSRRSQRRTLLQLLLQSEHLPELLRLQAKHLAFRYEFAEEDEAHPNAGDDLFKLNCVCYTADGWLLADGQLLRTLASTGSREAPRWNPPSPDTCKRPTVELAGWFRKCPNKRLKFYNKHTHNQVIIQKYLDEGRLDRMRVSQSFCRLVDTVSCWVNGA